MHPGEYDSISISDAVDVQNTLRESLELTPLSQPITTVGGADLSFNRFSTEFFAGIVVLSFPDLRLISFSLVKAEVHFPYVPGFLAFREVPVLMKAWELLPQKPGVLIADGHGIAHPRRMGIGAHFGALTQHPTIGCAKKLLFGHYEEPPLSKGSFSSIYDRDEVIGYALRTKDNVKPVFVSPGNLIDLRGSLDILQKCTGRYRIPEPTRIAHEMVNKFRTGEISAGLHTISPVLKDL